MRNIKKDKKEQLQSCYDCPHCDSLKNHVEGCYVVKEDKPKRRTTRVLSKNKKLKVIK